MNDVRDEWSDAELDAALGALRPPGNDGAAAVDAGRSALRAELGAELGATRTRRSPRRWLAAAAVLAVLVAGGLLWRTIPGGDGAAPDSAAAATLNQAADRLDAATDEPLGPGQYRYVGTRAWWMSSAQGGSGDGLAYLAENLIETWRPADETDDWLQRRDVTGERRWIVGTEADAAAAGLLEIPGWPEGELRAPCGDFYAADEGRTPACGEGGWQNPTAAWQASLPRDTAALAERLRADAPDNGRGDAELLVYVADALRSGLVEADLRAAMYRVLGTLPGLRVTEQAANLDGRVGVALGMEDGDTRHDIIVDTATGQFIGEREVTIADVGGVPVGTTLSYTSVTTAVVDAIGATPAG